MKRFIFCCALICALVAFTSCNVTRTVSTTSSYLVHGDTTTTIVTKTIESYDATKKQSINPIINY